MALMIPQGGHSVIAAVTAASLTLVGAAALTMVLETPLTQALAAAEPVARPPTVFRTADAGDLSSPDRGPARAKLAQCACTRWRRAAPNPADVHCAVDELVISQDWVVARLNLHDPDSGAATRAANGLDAPPRPDFHAVEVMHLIDGHVDEDWHLASAHDGR